MFFKKFRKESYCLIDLKKFVLNLLAEIIIKKTGIQIKRIPFFNQRFFPFHPFKSDQVNLKSHNNYDCHLHSLNRNWKIKFGYGHFCMQNFWFFVGSRIPIWKNKYLILLYSLSVVLSWFYCFRNRMNLTIFPAILK